ncbi:MAG TPA: TetR/AcrR family transcriptional regulator [Acidimicrobiales bacterium]
MTPVPRTRLSPDARRAQLVELGLQMLSTRSLDTLVVEDIAAAAGISRGLLFHYFPSKRDYREAVVRAAAADFLDHVAPDPTLPLPERLRSAVAAFVDYVSANRDTYVALVRGASGGDPRLRAVFDETRSEVVTRVVDHLTDLSGTEPPRRVRLAVRGWVAFAEEVVLDWLSEPRPDGDGGTAGGDGGTAGAPRASGTGDALDRDGVVELLDGALLALIASAAASGQP